MIILPAVEQFTLRTKGGIWYSMLRPMTSIRLAKFASKTDVNCYLHITKTSDDQVELSIYYYLEHKRNLRHIKHVSDFFDFTCDDTLDLKRPMTMTLPLPLWAKEYVALEHFMNGSNAEGDIEKEKDLQDYVISVLYVNSEKKWDIVKSKWIFTQSTVTFEAVMLSRYCLALCGRANTYKLKMCMPVIASCINISKGIILAFAILGRTAWYLWIEVAKEDETETITKKRLAKGFQQLRSVRVNPEDQLLIHPQSDALQVKQADLVHCTKQEMSYDLTEQFKTRDIDKDPNLCLALTNGVIFNFDVKDDIKFKVQKPTARISKVNEDIEKVDSNIKLQYHQHLQDNYIIAEIEPEGDLRIKIRDYFKAQVDKKTTACIQKVENGNSCSLSSMDNRISDAGPQFIGTLYCSKQQRNGNLTVTSKLKLHLSLDTIRYYYDPKYEGKAESLVGQPTVPQVSEVEIQKAKRESIAERIAKEPKVISTYSLWVLSRHINNGLNLAVHLNLDDSTITAIGMDSLTQGLNSGEVALRVLHAWKRKQAQLIKTATANNKRKEAITDMLQMLINALNNNDCEHLAEIVAAKNQENEELENSMFEESDE